MGKNQWQVLCYDSQVFWKDGLEFRITVKLIHGFYKIREKIFFPIVFCFGLFCVGLWCCLCCDLFFFFKDAVSRVFLIFHTCLL